MDNGESVKVITYKLQADTKQYQQAIQQASAALKNIGASSGAANLQKTFSELQKGADSFASALSRTDLNNTNFNKASTDLSQYGAQLADVTKLMRDFQRAQTGQMGKGESNKFLGSFWSNDQIKEFKGLTDSIDKFKKTLKPIKASDTMFDALNKQIKEFKTNTEQAKTSIQTVFNDKLQYTNKSGNITKIALQDDSAIWNSNSATRKVIMDSYNAQAAWMAKNNWTTNATGRHLNDTSEKGLAADNVLGLSYADLKKLVDELTAFDKNAQGASETTNTLNEELKKHQDVQKTTLEQARAKIASTFSQNGINLGDISNLDNKEVAKLFSDSLGQYQGQLNSDTLSKLQQLIPTFQQIADSANTMNKSIKNTSEGLETLANKEKGISELTARLMSFFTVGNAIHLVTRAIRNAYSAISDLDKSMTETAVVTSYTLTDLWGQLPKYTEVANELGVTTKGVYETMTLFYQQGLDTNQAFELGTETLKMARIAGLDYATATKYMTNALRGFNMELSQVSAQNVNDVYSKLAAISAADTEDIAVAMSKVASLANNAGMSLESTASFLTQIVETTQESAETAGTALKTVIARFTELKKSPDEIGEIDGEIIDANAIETALRSVGISLRDTAGQFRDLDDVFLELAQKWNDLDTNTQRYIATIAAGSRQQSRFIAMMSDYERTMELVNAANEAAGASSEQFGKTLDSLDAKTNRLKNSWNDFTMGLANNTIIKGTIDLLNSLLTVMNKLTSGGGQFSQSLSKIFLALGAFKIGGSLTKAIKTGVMNDPSITQMTGLKAGGQSFWASLQPRYGKQARQELLLSQSLFSKKPENWTVDEKNRYADLTTRKYAEKTANLSPEDTNKFIKNAEEADLKIANITQKLNIAAVAATGASIAFTQFGKALQTKGLETGNERLQKWGETLEYVGGAAGIAAAAIVAAIKVVEAGSGPIGWIIGAIGLLGALIYGIVKVVDVWNVTATESAEAVGELEESCKNAKEQFEELNDTIDNYTSLTDGLDLLIKGTEEYNEQLSEAIKLNAQLAEENQWFFEKYKTNAQYIDQTTGLLTKEGITQLLSENKTRAYAQAAIGIDTTTKSEVDQYKKKSRGEYWYADMRDIADTATSLDDVEKKFNDYVSAGKHQPFGKAFKESLKSYTIALYKYNNNAATVGTGLVSDYNELYGANLNQIFTANQIGAQWNKNYSDISAQNLTKDELIEKLVEYGIDKSKLTDFGQEDLLSKYINAYTAANLGEIDISGYSDLLQQVITSNLDINTIKQYGSYDKLISAISTEMTSQGLSFTEDDITKMYAAAVQKYVDSAFTGTGQSYLINSATSELTKAISGTTDVSLLYQTLKDLNGELSVSDELWQAHAIDVAAAQSRYTTLASTLQENTAILQKYDGTLTSHRAALKAVTEQVQKTFGNTNITSDWVLENQALLNEWAQGSIEAGLKVQKTLQSYAITQYGDATDEQIESLIQIIQDTYAAMAKAGEDGTFELGSVIQNGLKAGLNAPQLVAAIESLGIELTAETTQAIEDYADSLANGISINLGSILATNLVSIADFDSLSKATDPWINSLDRLFNLTEQINEQLRKRERLEKQYSRLLEDENASMIDLQQASAAQLLNLYQTRDFKQTFVDQRLKDIANLGNTKYVTSSGTIATWGDAVTRYASYNSKTGLIQIDWDGINKISDTELGGRVEEYVQKLQSLVEEVETTNDELYDIQDEVKAIKESQKQDWIDMINEVYDLIVQENQQRIDDYQTYTDALTESNNNILSALQEQIDLERQIRDNTKKEEDITDKENRLAYLQRDTANGNATEILQLQDELEEARQSYTDALVDQALSQLQKDNDKASNQREQQISIMSAQLDYLAQNGEFWSQAYDLMSGAINKDGTLNNNSTLVEMFKKSKSFQQMSTYEQTKLVTDLGTQFKAAMQGSAQWKIAEAESAGKLSSSQLSNSKIGNVTYDGQYWTDKNGNKYTLTYDNTTQKYGLTKYTAQAANYSSGNNGNGTDTIDSEVQAWKYGDIYYGSKESAIAAAEKDYNRKISIDEAGLESIRSQGGGQSAMAKEIENHISKLKNIKSNLDALITTAKVKKSLVKYKTGGLADFTGPAWLDGSKTSPELVLNSVDTKNFIELKDTLRALKSGTTQNIGGDTYFDINIDASLEDDYSVDQMASRIKEIIYHDAQYRNNNILGLSH